MTAVIDNWSDVVRETCPPLQDVGPFPPGELFFGAARSESAFGGEAGLAQGPSFTPAELDRIRALIKQQLVDNAQRISSKLATAIADTPLSKYHTISDNRDHGKLLSKLGRVLNRSAVDEIRQMSFFDYVYDAFGPYYLSDEEELGHEQICFRVVRPNLREDVGTLHRDAWFWDHFGFVIPEGISRTKVWVPVYGAGDQSGLLLAPGSHRQAGGFRTEMTDGKLCFVPELSPHEVQLNSFLGRPGDPIMFNYNLLHVGAVTRGDESRVSFEITIMYRSDRA
jgi:hypothetical protein